MQAYRARNEHVNKLLRLTHVQQHELLVRLHYLVNLRTERCRCITTHTSAHGSSQRCRISSGFLPMRVLSLSLPCPGGSLSYESSTCVGES
jgi:hypothetical protein